MLCISTSQNRILRREILIHCICLFAKYRDFLKRLGFFMCFFLMAERQGCVFENTQANEVNRLLFLFFSGFGVYLLVIFLFFFSFFFQDIFSINCDLNLQEKLYLLEKEQRVVLFQVHSWSLITFRPLVEIQTKQAFWEI